MLTSQSFGIRLNRKASCRTLALCVLSATAVLFAPFGVVFGSVVHPHRSASLVAKDFLTLGAQQQNTTSHLGDILVEHNDTLLIQDCQFNQTGKLIIKENAEVTISNATFISNWDPNETPDETYWRTKNLILQNQSKLTIVNSELILSANASYKLDYHSIIISDEATVNITDSKISYSDGLGDYVYCRNDSKVWMRNVVMSTFYPVSYYGDYPKSGLNLEDQSQAEVQNLTLDYLSIGQTADSWGGRSNCTVDIGASRFEYLLTAGIDFSNVEISSSNVSRVDISGQDSSVRLTNTIVGELNKQYEDAKVVLFDSSIQNIHVYAFSNMWVVWQLPLLGQVQIPYAWAPYIIPTLVTSVAIVFLIVGLALFLNARRKHIGKKA